MPEPLTERKHNILAVLEADGALDPEGVNRAAFGRDAPLGKTKRDLTDLSVRGLVLGNDARGTYSITDQGRAAIDGLERPAAPPRSRPSAVSPASSAQRRKVSGQPSIVSGEGPCDPAHLVPRSLGGCDDPLCVVPLTRREHDAYEANELDLLPHLLGSRCVAEIQHAVGHLDGSLLRALHVITGRRHLPEGG